MTSFDAVADNSIRGRMPSRPDALAVLSGDSDLLDVVAAAGRVRRHFFGNRVKLSALINLNRGTCPEDCTYCAHRQRTTSHSSAVTWIGADQAAQAAERAVRRGVSRLCLVAGGRRPGDRDIEVVSNTIGIIRARQPRVEICVGLGLLRHGQADRLRAAGAHAYNHNLDASDRADPGIDSGIGSAHTFADRADTVWQVASSGMSPCSGAVFGLGESDAHAVDLALGLRGLYPDSVPVDFVGPSSRRSPGRWALTPERCLRILALFRFCFPDVEVTMGHGRARHLRGLQPMGLHVANALYLDSRRDGALDRRLIGDAGFVVDETGAVAHDEYANVVH